MVEFTGNQTAVEVVFGFFMAFSCLNVLICVPLWVRRMRFQPLTSRPLTITITSQVLVSFYAIALGLQRIFASVWPCAVGIMLLMPTSLCIVNLYSLRSWILWYSYKLTEEKALFDTKPLDTLWYINNLRYAQRPFLFISLFGVTAAELLATIIAMVTHPRIYDQKIDMCTSGGHIYWMFTVMLLLYTIIFVLASRKFGVVEDAFYIKREIRAIGVSVAILGVIWLIVQFFEPINKEIFPFDSLALMIICIVIQCISLVFPVYKSYHMKSGRRFQLVGTQMSHVSDTGPEFGLAKILCSPAGQEKFKKHLMKEFSVENLLFWQACQDYKRDYDSSEDPSKAALAIRRKYLDEHAALQVNLYHVVSGRLLKNLDNGQLSAEVFDEAAKSVYKLMATDSFLRFEMRQQDARTQMSQMSQKSQERDDAHYV